MERKKSEMGYCQSVRYYLVWWRSLCMALKAMVSIMSSDYCFCLPIHFFVRQQFSWIVFRLVLFLFLLLFDYLLPFPTGCIRSTMIALPCEPAHLLLFATIFTTFAVESIHLHYDILITMPAKQIGLKPSFHSQCSSVKYTFNKLCVSLRFSSSSFFLAS